MNPDSALVGSGFPKTLQFL
ncbi:rCG22186 [Rattus norvegicus]|uniref:RCG22186 n=1 Tax=Rattus norvegicus TaxID=10116 RepID=A6IP84_RAT|nr:rCG22186 [Rattus norvegicus]